MSWFLKNLENPNTFDKNLYGGGKGGGSTAGMEEAAREANALQRQMYEESVERGEPFYQGGLEGFGTLLDYLGLQGGSQKSEQQLRDQLTDQFTSSRTETTGMGEDGAGWYSGGYGRGHEQKYFSSDPNKDLHPTQAYDLGYWSPIDTTTTRTITELDEGALNAAVQEQLAAQEENKPEYFGSLLTPFGQDQFEQDAGYQFRLEEGQKALERQLAAQGKTFSPEAAKALADYNQGMASQEYNTAYNRYNLDQGNIYNRLAGMAGMGQQQVAQLDTAGQQYAQNVSQTNASLANAQAAAEQSKGSMFDSLLGLGSLGLGAYSAGLFGGGAAASGLGTGGLLMMSDCDLKTNITEIGEQNGHKLYEFKYKGDDKRYIGVMAQEVMKTRPDAVCIINGSYAVDYGRLGIEMREV